MAVFSTIDSLFDRWMPVILAGLPAVVALFKIKELTIHVNSRMDKLIEVTASLARERGIVEGTKIARKEAENLARDLSERNNAGDTSKI